MNGAQPVTVTAHVVVAASAADMQALGERLGRLLRVGDVVGLLGPLGAGKTTFAQGLARGLEVPSERHVASPTFALVNQHPGRVPFVHVDLYRINSPAELSELGLSETYDFAAVAIEWLDRFPSLAPPDRLEVEIAPVFDAAGTGVPGAGTRKVSARGTGKRGAELAAALVSGAGR